MEDTLRKKICNFCMNNKSENCIKYCEVVSGGIISYKCENYIKDENKIIPFDKETDKAINDIVNTRRKYVI